MRRISPFASQVVHITESRVIASANVALETMHHIRAMGVQLSIDDFATGYPSLSYLKRFLVCKHKTDRSFVNDIHVDANDKATVDAILTLASAASLPGAGTNQRNPTMQALFQLVPDT